MSSAVAVQNGAGSIMEAVIAKGDLAQLKPEERARYYTKVCESIGVNPLTQPFQYITLNQKLTLYATKTATDQLRTVRGVSVFKIDAETVGDLRIVHAYARDNAGREDMDIGAVNIKGLQGEALANAYMKALTKAKRRVTLSICGLGWLDESEIEAIPNARPIHVDMETGEITESEPIAIDTTVTANVVTTESVTILMISERQVKMIGALADKIGMTWDQVKAMHGKASAKDLTRVEASQFIDQLQAIENDQESQTEPEQAELVDAPLADRYTR